MDNRFIQCLATVILFFGALCVGAADKYNWRDLAQTGATIVGVGGGILTGQKLTHLSTGDRSPISVTPDPKD